MVHKCIGIYTITAPAPKETLHTPHVPKPPCTRIRKGSLGPLGLSLNPKP